MNFPSLKIYADAGGQALGIEQAGFTHVSRVEVEPAVCQTIRLNRPDWNIMECDLRQYSGDPWRGTALLTAGDEMTRAGIDQDWSNPFTSNECYRGY